MTPDLLPFFSLGLFSFNLTLQLGLGLRELYKGLEKPKNRSLSQWVSIFLTTLGVWTLFSWVLSPLTFRFAEYFLVYPLSVFALLGLDSAFSRFSGSTDKKKRLFSSSTACSGLAAAAALLCLHIAATFTEAICLSLAFSGGGLLAFTLLRAVNTRSHGEKVPAMLRGLPLFLLSAALLALILTRTGQILLNR